MKKSSLKQILSLAAVGILSTSLGHASLLIDRGLPTANLNNSAGPDRSNVSWAFGLDTSGRWLVGDTFENTSSQTWSIDSIRLWTVGATGSTALWGGIEGSSISLVSGLGAISATSYSGALDYQGQSGNFSQINQIDFAVSITLAPGEVFNFFLDGTGNPAANANGVPFVHASNAGLSGSVQDGADNSMLYAHLNGGIIDNGDVGPWTSQGDGWDKASDVNVQVFGNAVPDAGSTLALMGAAFAGIAGLRRKFNA